MSSFKTIITINGQKHETLKDILPVPTKTLDILFIAKTPALKSVAAGHYFQGHHGRMFWNRLKDYNILKVRPNTFEDENLIENNFGLTDIVKVPRDFGNEPINDEYIEGVDRIMQIISKYKPRVLVFVYKRVLDNILLHRFNYSNNTEYGFNKGLEKFFNSRVFIFPMPGTPCTKAQATIAMTQLKQLLIK